MPEIDSSLLLEANKRSEWRAWLRGTTRPAKRSGWSFTRSTPAAARRLQRRRRGGPRLRLDRQHREEARRGPLRQRFTPRNPKSSYSESNVARLRAMAAKGKIVPEVLKKVKPLLAEKPIRVPPTSWPRSRPIRRPGRTSGPSRRLHAHPHRLPRPVPRAPGGVRQAPPQLPQDDESEPPHRLRRHPEALLRRPANRKRLLFRPVRRTGCVAPAFQERMPQ